jgi:hypothetical protein
LRPLRRRVERRAGAAGVGGGWLRGVARVPAQLPLELHDLSLQLLDPFGLLGDRPGLRLDQRDKLLARRQLRTGHAT